MRRLTSLLLAAILALVAVNAHAILMLGGSAASVSNIYFGATLPTAPTTFSTAMPTSLSCSDTNRGSCYTPGVGGDASLTLQDALNDAAAATGTNGDIIELQPGTTYTASTFTAPARSGTGTIYVLPTTAPEIGGTGLPGQGTRICPSDAVYPISCTANTSIASDMASLRSSAVNNGLVLVCANAASDYRFIGLDIEVTDGNTENDGNSYVVDWSHADTSTSTLCSYIVLDRDYIAGGLTTGVEHAIEIDGAYNAVINNYIERVFYPGIGDTNDVFGYNGTGPYQINNNWLHADGQPTFFGGDDSWIPDVLSSDIDIENNTLYKNYPSGTGSVNGTTTLTITAVAYNSNGTADGTDIGANISELPSS